MVNPGDDALDESLSTRNTAKANSISLHEKSTSLPSVGANKVTPQKDVAIKDKSPEGSIVGNRQKFVCRVTVKKRHAPTKITKFFSSTTLANPVTPSRQKVGEGHSANSPTLKHVEI